MDIELERLADCTEATVWWEVIEEATSNTFVVSDTWTMDPSETFGREIIWETNNQHRFIPDKWYKKRLASTLKNSKNPSNPVFWWYNDWNSMKNLETTEAKWTMIKPSMVSTLSQELF